MPPPPPPGGGTLAPVPDRVVRPLDRGRVPTLIESQPCRWRILLVSGGLTVGPAAAQAIRACKRILTLRLNRLAGRGAGSCVDRCSLDEATASLMSEPRPHSIAWRKSVCRTTDIPSHIGLGIIARQPTRPDKERGHGYDPPAGPGRFQSDPSRRYCVEAVPRIPSFGPPRGRCRPSIPARALRIRVKVPSGVKLMPHRHPEDQSTPSCPALVHRTGRSVRWR